MWTLAPCLHNICRYVPPTTLGFVLEGKTLESPSRKVKCEVTLETESKPMFVIDVLGHLPWLLRKIVQKFIAKPFLYLYYKDSVTTKISVGDTEIESTGKVHF